jgi:sigma-E factor negative regulatory protein RseB
MTSRALADSLNRWTLVLLGLAALCLAPPARAGGEVVPGPQARQWVVRMAQAATQRNYQGTLVVGMGAEMSSSRVLHYCEGAHSFERVDMLDGQPRSVLRHNDQVLTLWPAAKVARLDEREAVAPFPALPAGAGDQLFEHYDMVAEGPGRIAGHDAAVFLMRPRDAARFAQRLWAAQGSGLLLRADVIAPDGRVLETSAFSDLSLGAKPRIEGVQTTLKQLEGWRVIKRKSQRTTLEAEGWQLKPPAPGFRQASCVKRALDDNEGAAASQVVQAIYSDGLTHVSLFIEPHRPERHRAGGAVIGATHTWMQALGEHWITAMGDVPLATLKHWAQRLEPKR